MPHENVALQAFNRGVISSKALARTDIKRTALSAESSVNWMPRVLGSMMLRPGTQYLGSSYTDLQARYIPFVFSTDDTALVEITNFNMRVWINDELVTRLSVSSAVTNGTFDTDVSGWTDNDEAGGTSVWVAGGYLGLTGNGTAAAIRDQQITVAVVDRGVEHALRIVIQRGPVTMRVGSSSGDDDYITETDLGTGTHSLTFTPTGDFHIRFMSRLKRQVRVSQCSVESSGVMVIPSPWDEGDLDTIRFDQSGDVLFVACDGKQQRRIERRMTRGWSVVLYQANDGPFMGPNIDPTTLTPSALSGNITVTASAPYFKSTNVGSLFRITSAGQNVSQTIVAENTFTNAIEVFGVDTQRVFTFVMTENAPGTCTFTLQRSLESSEGPWTDVLSRPDSATETYDDGLDNQIAWYRVGVKTAEFGSGSHDVSLSYTVGFVDGIVRVTDFTSATSVSAEVIVDLGSTSDTDDWAEGEWSERRGFPSSVAFAEGRLWWAGKNGVWGSISDAFDAYDENEEGDAGPIIRTIGSGPVDTINWIVNLQRLILGAEGAEWVCKSSSFDEPLTPTNFNIRPASTRGSATVDVAKIDKRAVYVQRGGSRIMELSYDPDDGEYGSNDLTQLCPEICEPQIVRIAIQRQPDTRIHCVRSDGKVAISVFDPVEQVLSWQLFETDGDVEDVVVLPGDDGTNEDNVYYHVNRTINGSTKRYLEKWAREDQCVGGSVNRQADCFITYSQASSSTISGLDHLEGESVVVWDNGKCLREAIDPLADPQTDVQDPQEFAVVGGSITVINDGESYQATVGVVGIPYTAQWKSTKLAYAAGMGTALTQMKRLSYLGAILQNTHHRGLKYGPDFNNLSPLPRMEDGKRVSEDTIHAHYDEMPFEFEGTWDSDARLCLQAEAPRPCTILAAMVPVETNEKY